MKKVKSNKSNLERKRFTLFQLGLISALALSLAAFEWTNYNRSELTAHHWDEFETIELEEQPPVFIPEKPKVQQPKANPSATNINLVEEIIKDSKLEKDEKPLELDLLDVPIGDGEGDCLDCEEESFTITKSTTMTAAEVYNKPHYKSCQGSANLLECTEGKILKFIGRNAIYPSSAPREGGTVYVSFIVSETGDVEDVKVIESDSEKLNNAALRVIQSLPKLEPGTTKDGKPVRVVFRIPIRFSQR
ncbi:energy transducer TonB [Halocola ammonii]